jgi:uncharacterized iron-regulated protein
MRALLILLALAWGPAAGARPVLDLTAASAHPLAGTIVEARSGATLSPEALIDRLESAEIAFVGEVHDNPDHHAAQAWIAAALAPEALAFEMIPRDAEDSLARLRRAGASAAELGAALEWQARGWPDFAMYAPILAAAPEAEVTGAEVSRAALGAAIHGGLEAAAAATIGAAAGRYGLFAPMAAEQEQALVAELIASHCDAIPVEAARAMAPMQRLRDAALADAALRGRAYGGGRTLVILGNGHARRDRGAPAYLAEAVDIEVAVVGMVELVEGAETWSDYADAAALYDFVWFTAPAERDDPCAAFLRQRQEAGE